MKLAKNDVINCVETLYELLRKDTAEIAQIDSIFEENKGNVNFICDLDPYKLAFSLIGSSPEKIQSFKFNLWYYLTHGYYNEHYSKILLIITALQKEIRKQMKNLKYKPVSKFNLNELIEVFEKKFIPALEKSNPIPME
jgi:hypothetical protein